MSSELVQSGWKTLAVGTLAVSTLAVMGLLLPACSKEETPAAAVPPTQAEAKPAEAGAPDAAASGEREAKPEQPAGASEAAPEAKVEAAPPPPPPPPPPAADVCAVPKKLQKTRSGLQYALLTEGEGPLVKKGQQITVHYTGWLRDCSSKFDSSRGGRPFSFKVGEGLVIDGWEEAALLLHVGDKATLVIPPKLGYGAEGSPPEIPGSATLVFNIEVLAAK